MDLENIWYELDIPDIGTTIIGVVYKHPNCTVVGWKQFTDSVINNIHKINKENKQLVLMGDINADGLRINQNEHVRNFFEQVLENDCIPQITIPTRIQDGKCSTIDHIIINNKLMRKVSKKVPGNMFSDLSDHLPVFLILKKKEITKTIKERPMVRLFGEKILKSLQIK